MAARIPSPRFTVPSEREECKDLAAPYKIRRFFTPEEVAQHNSVNMSTSWVSLFGKVYDITTLIHDNASKPEIEPLKKAVGSDITHWFNPETKDPLTHIDPDSNLLQPYHP